jgi:NAD(P)-dependent dehydrogenase (short-subunit alcohol dehydrogenase family)
MANLSNEIAVVTGAGSGIGRAMTLRLARDGARVLASDINGGALEETLALARQENIAVSGHVADVADEDAPDRILGAADTAYGPVSLLLNNAGMGHAEFPTLHDAETTSDAEFDRIMAVNMRSLFRMARGAIARMKPKKHGVIVNVASIFGMTGVPRTTAYATAKAAIVGMTREMAADCGPMGIRVNAISPGLIETAMTEKRLLPFHDGRHGAPRPGRQARRHCRRRGLPVLARRVLREWPCPGGRRRVAEHPLEAPAGLAVQALARMKVSRASKPLNFHSVAMRRNVPWISPMTAGPFIGRSVAPSVPGSMKATK